MSARRPRATVFHRVPCHVLPLKSSGPSTQVLRRSATQDEFRSSGVQGVSTDLLNHGRCRQVLYVNYSKLMRFGKCGRFPEATAGSKPHPEGTKCAGLASCAWRGGARVVMYITGLFDNFSAIQLRAGKKSHHMFKKMVLQLNWI